jgi:hypothetical protein
MRSAPQTPRRVLIAGAAWLLLVIRGETAGPDDGAPAAVEIMTTLGERQVVLEDGQLGLRYFPDLALSFLQEGPSTRLLLVAGVSTRLLEGRDIHSLRAIGESLRPGPPGSFDNGYAGIGGAVRDPESGALWALYHAEDQEGMTPIAGGIPGFFASIGLAVSRDDGKTFVKSAPVITSAKPKDRTGRPDQGCGEPSAVIDRDGEYLLAYYVEHSRTDGRGVQICLARSRLTDRGQRGTWWKYHEGQFDSPGLEGPDTPVVSARALGADAIFPQVRYVAGLGRYVMVFNINAYRELADTAKPEKSGLYIATSSDGIRWSRPTRLLAIVSVPVVDREIGCHPTLVVTRARKHSVAGRLYYAYSARWGHEPPRKPHHLVLQPVQFSVRGEE